MAATYPVQGEGHPQSQGQGYQPQPVVVHVHVHMHGDKQLERQERQEPVVYDHPRQYPSQQYQNPYQFEAPSQRSLPAFYETPQRSFQYARTLGLPQPRPMYPQRNQVLPRLLYTDTDHDPVPVVTNQTPRLVHQYSPNNAVSMNERRHVYNAEAGNASPMHGNDVDNTRVRYVYRESRPIESVVPSSSSIQNYRQNYLQNRAIEQNKTQDLSRKEDIINYDANHTNEATKSDIGPIFRPGYSEKYVRNVRRETVVKPGVRLPNMVSIDTQETSSNQHEDVDRTVYKPLKEVFTDKQDGAPVSFDLRKPTFPYNFGKSGGMSGSRSMTSLSGNSPDKHVVFERAKYRPVYRDEATGKTFRIHSMNPIEEENRWKRLDGALERRFGCYDDSYKPVYKENPAAPPARNKRYSMPAELATFRIDNPSPADQLKRDAEEAEQLHSILKNAR